MTGGTWKDTSQPARSKKPKAKQQKPARTPTTKHVRDVSRNMDAPTQDDQDKRFQAQLDLIDLKMRLQRWTFARSWRTARSSPPPAEASRHDISPWCLPQDVENPPIGPGKARLIDGDLVPLAGHCANAVADPYMLLDRHLMGQYLDGCIAAAEAQLAKATNKAVKEEAVKEIERLVERVVGEAGRLGARGG